MLIGIIIGVFFFLMGLLIFISAYLKDKRCTCETTAVILDVTKEIHWRYRSHGSRRQTYYYPFIEFSTPEKTIRVKAIAKALRPEVFIKGEQLTIQYNPDNPYDLKLQGNSLLEAAIGMGIMFLLGGMLIYISVRAY